MKYTVIWTPSAERKLVELCVGHFDSDLAAIGRAGDRIDELLREDPEAKGIHNFDVVRTLHIFPLTVDFEVDAGDMKVLVLTVWHAAEPQ